MTRSRSRSAEGYERVLESNSRAASARSHAARDIDAGFQQALAGIDWDVRNSCYGNLRLFLETYLAEVFPLEWGPDHLEVIERLAECVHGTDLYALAMPRGSGKTSLSVGALLYAALYSFKRFVVLIAATEEMAEGLLDVIVRTLEHNDLLLRDFPEATFPLRALEGEQRRATGQHIAGIKTEITRGKGTLILPHVLDNEGQPYPASGIVIRTLGITAAIRGLQYKQANGAILRPDLVLADDVQTKRSADSPADTNKREVTIKSDVLGLAGPRGGLSCLMTMTVIRKGDLADRFLDRGKHPRWNGQRYQMLRSLPANLALWDEFYGIYSEDLRAGLGRARADEFYRSNQAAMDAGAEASWPARIEEGDLSAVQTSMLKRLTDPVSFASEYQNQPINPNESGDVQPIDPDMVAEKLSNIPRGTIPAHCTRLTAAVDVGQDLLWWTVVAWDETFGGQVVDYGCFPDQPVEHFTKANPPIPLSQVFPNTALEGQLYSGLKTVADLLLRRKFNVQDSAAPMQIEKMLIDAGWGQHRDLIHRFCRNSGYATRVMPSSGEGSSAIRGFDDWRKIAGDRTGTGFRVKGATPRFVQSVRYDANYWKSFVAERFRSIEGSPGCLSLFGSRRQTHDQFSQHLASEYPTRVTASGKTFDEWRQDRNHDNDWFDTVVMAAVAAAVTGTRFSPTGEVVVEAPPVKVSYKAKAEAKQRATQPPSVIPSISPAPQPVKKVSYKAKAEAARGNQGPRYNSRGRRIL